MSNKVIFLSLLALVLVATCAFSKTETFVNPFTGKTEEYETIGNEPVKELETPPPVAKEDRERAFEAYCAYASGMDQLKREVDFLYGPTPSFGYQPGEIVTLINDVLIFSGSTPENADTRTRLNAKKAIGRLPAGTKFKILERHWFGNTGIDLEYKVSVVGSKTRGYVEASVIHMPGDSLDAAFRHGEKRGNWEQPQKEALEKKIFEDNGLDMHSVRRTAFEENWYKICPGL